MSRYNGRASRKAIERDFPHIVEIAVPRGGLRKQLDAMHAFHAERGISACLRRGRHAAALPVDQRDGFLRDVAARLTDAPSDDAVAVAVNIVLDRRAALVGKTARLVSREYELRAGRPLRKPAS